jgi:hypothetical protein
MRALILVLAACGPPVVLQTIPPPSPVHPCDIPPAPVRPSILSEEPKAGVLVMSIEQFNSIVKYEIDFANWAQGVMTCREK